MGQCQDNTAHHTIQCQLSRWRAVNLAVRRHHCLRPGPTFLEVSSKAKSDGQFGASQRAQNIQEEPFGKSNRSLKQIFEFPAVQKDAGRIGPSLRQQIQRTKQSTIGTVCLSKIQQGQYNFGWQISRSTTIEEEVS